MTAPAVVADLPNLPAEPEGMASVTKEDANNYCRILTLLGMEEEGDPVEEVRRLVEQSQALPAHAERIAAALNAAEQPARDREADRRRFPDPAFNKWLDEGISDAGHTVWDSIADTCSAWHGWQSKDFYTFIHAAQSEFVSCEDCNGTGHTDDYWPGSYFQPPEPVMCSTCGGSGRLHASRIGYTK